MIVDRDNIPLWKRLFTRLFGVVLSRVWYVGSPIVMIVQATPYMCLQTLMEASKPNVQRLHLSKLYTQGKRYSIQQNKTNFIITMTSKVVWHYRRRTTASTVVRGEFVPLSEGVTRIQMRGRINPTYLLTSLSFFIPFFMASILLYTPWWHPAVVLVILATMYALSWAGHRFNAQIEVNDIVWFTQIALDDFIPSEIIALNDGVENIVYDPHEFELEWEKFYEEHKP
ncbi:MAG: hypothetical protein RLP44_00790 [Aggregatilineales bacterium]